MKKWFCLIALSTVSCDKREQVHDITEASVRQSPEWITYEGRVPLTATTALYIEVALRPANENGDGQFELHEFFEEQNTASLISSFNGTYTTLYGRTPDEKIVQFHHTALADGLERTYLAPASKHAVIRTERFRTRDLTVSISGKNKLIVLDDQMRSLTGEPEHNLVQRLAKPFTIEGYFRHNGYSADFFEINTGESWSVTKYGEYEKAIRQYYNLTEKKFEVSYLKGIGFPMRQLSGDGSEAEALVIKKVLQMTSAPAINGQK